VTFVVMQSAGPIGGNFNFSAGTLPAATPAYVANVTQSIDQTAVLLTVTAGPVWNAAIGYLERRGCAQPEHNWSDRLNWQLPGAPTAGDNVIFITLRQYSLRRSLRPVADPAL